MTQLYRMNDRPDAESRAAIPTTRDEAKQWNTPELGFGIFITVNDFNGARRKENLTKINAWAVDMDDGTKAQMHAKLSKSPLVPTMIVETKRGYQAWWGAKDGCALHWNAIVLERLVPHFGSDANARDLCRILRVPGFLHLKDPTDPFKCRLAWKHGVEYSERQIAEAFMWTPDRKAQQAAHDDARRAAEVEIREQAKQNAIAAGLTPTESLWDAIYALDCEDALGRLSGHWAVSSERYKFVRTSHGKLNIYVDSGAGWKSTPCFIDENKRIGSPSGGGPTIVQWLRWFRHDWRTVINVLKEVFPRLAEIDDQQRNQRRAA
jgi:hypothetical protein